ncbi:MAG: potassium-transporting ATPase subunit KdpB, partial [Cytophagaceae bacterium]|nr:potassium-transporting ATPase subunit KdpB [Gemmatimonadaceae bacterium]
MSTTSRPLFDPPIVRRAARDAFAKLHPRNMARNPVMFVVEVGSVLTSIVLVRDVATGAGELGFTLQLTLWLWFTVLFANFAEAMAEGRGKAQADALRSTRTQTRAKKVDDPKDRLRFYWVLATELERDDVVYCEPGDIIPSDGEVISGVASVDESAITGESAPVIRESGGDRSAVTGGTKVLSDWLLIRITAGQGETFLDRMIALVEGASRQKTPNEIALTILLSGLTLVFLFAVVTLQPFALYSGTSVSTPVLVALLVCLIPTTIGGLLSAIGIAGMDRMIQKNVIAMSGRAVEAAGDVNTLLLDKTGTITLGNRQAASFHPMPGVTDAYLADRAQLSSLADETPEGRSIVVLAKEKYGLRGRELADPSTNAASDVLAAAHGHVTFVPFTATTRMSGVDMGDVQLRKGAGDAVSRWVQEHGGNGAPEVRAIVERIAHEGGTPLVVAERAFVAGTTTPAGPARVLGVIYLKDVVKGGMRERFARFRAMGIRTVMITGDNPLTAAAIAQEAGVDDFLAEASPEDKMALIKREQAGGRLVAMAGDGTNDAPAMAQADGGLAMNNGTQAAKEAGNKIDLDSNPTKLIEVVEIGKQ